MPEMGLEISVLDVSGKDPSNGATMPAAVVESESKRATRTAKIVNQHIIEIVSDSGEGAQTCGQMFAEIGPRKVKGIGTGQIIPAESEPPSRSRAGASG